MTTRQLRLVLKANESGLTKRLAKLFRGKGTVKMVRATKFVLKHETEWVKQTIVLWVLQNCHAKIENVSLSDIKEW